MVLLFLQLTGKVIVIGVFSRGKNDRNESIYNDRDTYYID